MKAVDTGWKKEMDALMKRTHKNWWTTGKNKKSCGVSATLNLGKAVRA